MVRPSVLAVLRLSSNRIACTTGAGACLRMRTGSIVKSAHDRPGRSQNDIRRKRDQLRSVSAKAIKIACAPTVFDPRVTADGPAPSLQPLRERRDHGQCIQIVRAGPHEDADAPHALSLLAAGR